MDEINVIRNPYPGSFMVMKRITVRTGGTNYVMATSDTFSSEDEAVRWASEHLNPSSLPIIIRVCAIVLD